MVKDRPHILFTQLLDVVTEAVVLVDNEDNILQVNQSGQDFLSISSNGLDKLIHYENGVVLRSLSLENTEFSFKGMDWAVKKIEGQTLFIGKEILTKSYVSSLDHISKEILGSSFSDANDHHYDHVAKLLVFLDKILSGMPGNVYWKDKDSIYLGCNKQLSTIAGLESQAEIHGKDDYYFERKLKWSPGTADRFRQEDQAVMSTCKPVKLEDRFIEASGREVIMTTVKTPVFDRDNNVQGILAVSLYIVDLKKAKEKAEAANEVKSEFLKNIRHDIRTPFSGILSLAEILKESEKDPTRLTYFDMHIDAIQSVLGYLNEIVDYIDIEEGVVPKQSKLFSITAMIDDLQCMLLPTINKKSIFLEYLTDEELPDQVVGDEFRIKRILLNLLSNAVKFTHEGGVKLEAKYLQQTKDRVEVEFIVVDTGIGIPKEKYDFVFDKFSRVESSYEGQYTGQGLGLHIVKQFVDELGAKISIDEPTGCGTTFRLKLSLAFASSGLCGIQRPVTSYNVNVMTILNSE